MISNASYPVEIHEITTEDGYILKLHRIPIHNSSKRPVLVMHGIISSAADYVVCGPKRALGTKTGNKVCAYICIITYSVAWHSIKFRLHSIRQRLRCLVRQCQRQSIFQATSYTKSGKIGILEFQLAWNRYLRSTGNDWLYPVGHQQNVNALCRPFAGYNNIFSDDGNATGLQWKNYINARHVSGCLFSASQYDAANDRQQHEWIAGWQLFWITMYVYILYERYIAQSATAFVDMIDVLMDNADSRSSIAVFCGEGIITQTICKNALFGLTGFNSDQFSEVFLHTLLEIQNHSLLCFTLSQCWAPLWKIRQPVLAQSNWSISVN